MFSGYRSLPKYERRERINVGFFVFSEVSFRNGYVLRTVSERDRHVLRLFTTVTCCINTNLDRITCRSIEEGTASIGILVQLVGRFKGRCLSTAKQAVIVTTAIDL